jgi:hypothetical protein
LKGGNALKRFILILSLLISLICFVEQAQAENSETALIVQVESGTKNGSSITGDVVTVVVYEHKKRLLSIDSVVDSNGRAVFENVPIGAHIIYVPTAKHQEMLFNGRIVGSVSGKDKIFTSVQVFDVSDDKSKLSIPVHHIIIKASSDTLNISEYMQLKNSSDMAVGSKQVDNQGKSIVLEIMLPHGYRNFSSSSYLERKALVFTENGFYDTLAVPPGEYSISFSYSLDIDSATLDFVKGLTLPVSSLVIFTNLGEAKLQGLGEPAIFTDPSGAQMNYYKLDSLAAEDEVSFLLTGFSVSRFRVPPWAVMAVVIVTIIVIVLLRLRFKKKNVTEEC